MKKVVYPVIHSIFMCRTNALQKAIFRAKNNGNSLKIKLPFENILDIEQTEAFEFQKFLKIRAVDIDDNFVMDEVNIYTYTYLYKMISSYLCLVSIVLLCLFFRYTTYVSMLEKCMGNTYS